MDWLGNIGNAVGGFFNSLFGGNKDDEERKRRERERQQQQRQQQQQARKDSAVQSTQSPIPLMNQQKDNDPFNINKHFGMPNQQDKQKPAFDLTLGKNNNTKEVNGRPVVDTPKQQPKVIEALGHKYTQQSDGKYRSQTGQTRTKEQLDKFIKIDNDHKEREKKINQDQFWGTVGAIASAPGKVVVEAPAHFLKDVITGAGEQLAETVWTGD